jgi:23S rRNA (uridine2552-2'-O)-methyltransferase
MTRRSRGGSHWRKKQSDDPFVQLAAREGWRSRAVFKLAQIDEKAQIFRRGQTCIDLGAAPGGWSQYASRAVGETGRVVAVDLLPIEPLPGVTIIEGDLSADDVLERVTGSLKQQRADVVMSDMAPNISGMRAVDQARAMQLADDALAACADLLVAGGDFIVKLFQGEGYDAYIRRLRAHFSAVKQIKPKASRPESRETYTLARGYRV